MSVAISKRIKGFSVLTPSQSAQPTQKNTAPTDADRRLVLTQVATPLANSMRWVTRPDDSKGHPSMTYHLRTPEGNFSIHVVNMANGQPFECWVNDGAPRAMNALCKSLSMDMRQNDWGWIKTKLESLFTARGTPFDFMGPDGVMRRVPSAVAAFARCVHYRCEELGCFQDEMLAKTPVLDALMSRKEPKAVGTGTMGWMVPISNPLLGDDFEMILKEVQLEDGTVVPQSIWLSGRNYPMSLEGLAIALSYDIRVNDVSWVVRKLEQLIDLHEAKGEFWATVPGSDKQMSYPSIVAYMGALILHRFKMLGHIDDERRPRNSTGAMLELVNPSSTSKEFEIRGQLCDQCQAYAMVPTDGSCLCCKLCGNSKC